MSRRIPTYLADPEAAAVVQRRAANLRRLRRELNLSAPVLARRAGIELTLDALDNQPDWQLRAICSTCHKTLHT